MYLVHPFQGAFFVLQEIKNFLQDGRTDDVTFYSLIDRRRFMDSRVALIGIVVEKEGSVEALNKILHEYGKYIIGRMGIPYSKRNINIISIAVDAPSDVISALSGKLGMLDGVSSKAVYSKLT